MHDAQVILPEKRQRRHGHAFRLALGILRRIVVAVQTARRREENEEEDGGEGTRAPSHFFPCGYTRAMFHRREKETETEKMRRFALQNGDEILSTALNE